MTTTKKLIRVKKILLGALALCLLLSTLAACSGGGLSGTYRSQGLISQTFTFSGGNRITMSAFGINASGTYKINGNRMIVTYSIFGMDTSWSCQFERRGRSIFIDGTEFIKQ